VLVLLVLAVARMSQELQRHLASPKALVLTMLRVEVVLFRMH
jgi:hypothetical protein